ncbi:MAG: hypothetical protein JSV26_11350 [bacterium]|nr:MAG: hypothetical protein JSV26_11350 [bacterium]
MKRTLSRGPALTLFLLIIVAVYSLSGTVCRADADSESLDALEEELTEIEQELVTLEQKVDGLLEDLIDPKVTSFSIFFSQADHRESTPLSLEFRVDGQLLAARQLSEADRLVLLKGGALEIYSGVIEPGTHNITVQGLMRSNAAADPAGQSIKAVFKFEPRRASSNFVEIILSTKDMNRGASYILSAKYWAKEF